MLKLKRGIKWRKILQNDKYKLANIINNMEKNIKKQQKPLQLLPSLKINLHTELDGLKCN